MKKIYLLIIVFLLLYPVLTKVYGQDKKIVDSLKLLIANGNEDTLKAKHINDLVWYLKFTNPDTCLLLLDKSESLSKKLNFADGLGNSYNNRAIIYTVSGNFSEALKYYQLAIEQFQKNRDARGVGFCFSNMAICYEYQSKFDSALLFNKKALEIRKINGLLNGIAQSNINIGVIYFNKGFYKLALKYYFDALKYYENIPEKSAIDNSYLGSIQNNIGNIYVELKDTAMAKKFFNAAFSTYQNAQDKREMGYLYNDWGDLFHLQGNYRKSIEYYRKALKLAGETNEILMKSAALLGLSTNYLSKNMPDSALFYANKGIAAVKDISNERYIIGLYLNIGTVYMKKKNWQKAIKNFKSAIESAKKAGIVKQTDEALFSMAECYSNMDSAKAANNYLRQYIVVSDSILNSDKHKQIAEMEAVYENDKKTLLLKIKDADNRELKNKNSIQYLIIIIGSVLVFVLILAFIYVRKLQKVKLLQIEQQNKINIQQASLKTQREERKRVANILHDNLAHLIQNSQQKLNNTIADIKEEKPRQKLLQIEDNLTFMNKLAKVASYELEFSFVLEKNLVDQFARYIGRIEHSHSPKINFTYSNKNDFDLLSDEIKINVFSVFQEMLGNAVKYANAESITVSLYYDNGKTTLQVTDDGIGFNYDEVRHGQGFVNMKERAEKLNGTFSFESEPGFGTKLTFVV